MLTQITFCQEDITDAKVEAIVNAANSALAHGSGVARAIADAAGAEFQTESKAAPHCPVGQAVATTGGKLYARYVIHAVGPKWRGGENGEAALLASAYANAVNLGVGLGVHSLAFPSISTGVYGYPLERAALIALSAVDTAWAKNSEITEIRFCFFSARDLAV